MTSRCAAATLMHSVTAGEGATAADLRGALAIVPPFAELVDFSTDTDVVLVFAATEPELIRSTGPELDGADRPPDPQPAQVTIDRRGPDSAGDRNAVTKSTSEE
jgi:uncharacterized repeat protein (TIGR03917 family)